MRMIRVAIGTMALMMPGFTALHAQVIGSSDNFDCFNDTGQEAEGFEIDVEDVSAADLTREFPSNFSTTPWVIRYGLPTVTSYDFTSTAPDAQHGYDAGHKGVLITWAATWNGTGWVAQYGLQPFGAGIAGNGTPYVAHPTYTNGDSCWYYGLGAAYPTSGCDHFGISFAAGVTPGKLSYHWKIPDPANPGALINGASVASLPPTPLLAPVPPVAGQPPVVNAAALPPPEVPEPVWGPAYFLKVTTYYTPVDAQLDLLQKANVKKAVTKKIITYSVLQNPPAGQAGEKDDVENDQIAGKNISVTKQYEYFAFAGDYDGETHEATCDSAYKTQADALAGTNANPNFDSCQLAGNYWVIDPLSNLPVHVKSNEGQYLGAHLDAYNVK